MGINFNLYSSPTFSIEEKRADTEDGWIKYAVGIKAALPNNGNYEEWVDVPFLDDFAYVKNWLFGRYMNYLIGGHFGNSSVK